ncbi:hypothetical protein DFJ74DRAFT_411098 [Hyaloraphidium curvatum]|nr:hypothetical protein DFJ74DRAFT_411098 [Hyaloraphidium curvatum]
MRWINVFLIYDNPKWIRPGMWVTVGDSSDGRASDRARQFTPPSLFGRCPHTSRGPAAAGTLSSASFGLWNSGRLSAAGRLCRPRCPRTPSLPSSSRPLPPMATAVRKEKTFGTLGKPGQAFKDESLEDFLKDFTSSVTTSAVVSVKEGKAKYLKDIPGGGDLERQLKKKAVEIGAPLPPPDAFVESAEAKARENIPEAWPELDHPVFQVSERELRQAEEKEAKDNASVFSKTASSIRSKITQSKQNGVSDLPGGLLIADAKQKREAIGRQALNASRARRAWDTVRTHVDSPVAIILNNQRAGSGPVVEPATERDEALPVPEAPKIDPREAFYLAAIEAHEKEKAKEKGAGEKEAS